MQIDFYEEFPTKENLEKLKLIKFKVRLFVAAKSLERFKELEKQIKKIKKNVEVAYWPIIKNSYWISPFSNTKDLKETFKQLDKINNRILIDLELPLKRKMILKNFFSFPKNKKLIKKFLEKNKHRITAAEYPSSLILSLLKILGLDYEIDYEKNPMLYTSMILSKRKIRIKNYLSNLILHKEVLLKKDVSEYDKYGRLVRYIYIEDIFVNEDMVKAGWAVTYPYHPDTTLCPQIQKAENLAKNNELGIWKKEEIIIDEPKDKPKESDSEICNCEGNIYNCPDFTNQAEAQACFDFCGEDIHALDRDKDGLACESLS